MIGSIREAYKAETALAKIQVKCTSHFRMSDPLNWRRDHQVKSLLRFANYSIGHGSSNRYSFRGRLQIRDMDRCCLTISDEIWHSGPIYSYDQLDKTRANYGLSWLRISVLRLH
jgi:hypothetical protein